MQFILFGLLNKELIMKDSDWERWVKELEDKEWWEYQDED